MSFNIYVLYIIYLNLGYNYTNSPKSAAFSTVHWGLWSHWKRSNKPLKALFDKRGRVSLSGLFLHCSDGESQVSLCVLSATDTIQFCIIADFIFLVSV